MTPPAVSSRRLDAAGAVADFGEVVGGLSAEEATYEARRCLSCGNCFECDGCLGACPEDAVIKLGRGHRYRVRLRPLHRLRRLLRAVPGARHRDGAGARLMRAHDRRQRGGRVGRLPAQRGVLHLPDHAVVADGRAGRRVVQPGAGPTCGAPSRRSWRCRARAARRARCTARCRAARWHDVHRVAGPAADDPEHVQDRRRADLGGASTSPPDPSPRRDCRSSATTPT